MGGLRKVYQLANFEGNIPRGIVAEEIEKGGRLCGRGFPNFLPDQTGQPTREGFALIHSPMACLNVFQCCTETRASRFFFKSGFQIPLTTFQHHCSSPMLH